MRSLYDAPMAVTFWRGLVWGRASRTVLLALDVARMLASAA